MGFGDGCDADLLANPEDDKTLIFNQNNRLVQVNKNTDIIGEYVYNGLGQRVTKTVAGLTIVFLYDFDGNIIAKGQPDGTLSSDFLYMFGNRICHKPK